MVQNGRGFYKCEVCFRTSPAPLATSYGVQAGYREGITAGKESALQEGFDDGFALVGAPLGRAIGLLRGAANAAMGFVSSRASDTDANALEQRKNEVRTIIGSLGRINLEDLAPRDAQAEEHAKEHLDNGTSSDVFELDAHNVGVPKSENNQIGSKPAIEELDQLRTQLSNVLQEIGLDIFITDP